MPLPRDKYTQQVGPIVPTPEQIQSGLMTEPAVNMAILCGWNTPSVWPAGQPPLRLHSITMPLSASSNDTTEDRSLTIDLVKYNSQNGRPMGTSLGSATFPVPFSAEPTYRTFTLSDLPGWPALNASTDYGIMFSCPTCASPAQSLVWHQANSLISYVETRNGFGTGLCAGRPDPSKPDEYNGGSGYGGFWMQAVYGP